MLHQLCDWEKLLPYLDMTDISATEVHLGVFSCLLKDKQSLAQSLQEWLDSIGHSIIHVHHNGKDMLTENVQKLVNERNLLMLVTSKEWIFWQR